jgi:hypothetical protein
MQALAWPKLSECAFDFQTGISNHPKVRSIEKTSPIDGLCDFRRHPARLIVFQRISNEEELRLTYNSRTGTDTRSELGSRFDHVAAC